MRIAVHPFRLLAVAALAASAVAGTAVAAPTPAAAAAPCSDVDVVFARGTGEAAGLGSVGSPFASAVASQLSGYSVSTYAVAYAAATNQQSAGPGASDMSAHVASVASACPGTRFVLGGYSQGATVTDLAVGITSASSSRGNAVPAQYQSRVAAVVVFGNPIGARRQTIASASPTYGARSKDYCNSSDSVCGSYQPTGTGSHLSYVSNGSASQGAAFAANLVRTGGAPGGGGGGGTPTPTPPTAACVTASTLAHVNAGRAVSVYGRAYAVGSRDSLGATSAYVSVSLRQNGDRNWSLVRSC